MEQRRRQGEGGGERVGRGFHRPFGEGADGGARPCKSEVRLGFDNEAPAAAALGFRSGRGAGNYSKGGAPRFSGTIPRGGARRRVQATAAAAAAAAPFRVGGPGCEVPGGAGAARRAAALRRPRA